MSDGLFGSPSLSENTVSLRPYQEEAVAAVRSEFVSGKKSTLLVLPTGTGKTMVFGTIARKAIERDNRVLILAHRTELIEQAAEKLIQIGVIAGVEKGNSFARSMYEPDVVIATVQTLKGKRLESWPKDHFKIIITDECFPAGTLIDGHPIQTVRIGDYVSSFSERTRLEEKKPVTRLFQRKPSGLVRIHFDNGSSLVCTPDHPIFTFSPDFQPEYVAAKYLTGYNMVYGITPIQKGTSNGDFSQGLRGLQNGICSPKLEQHNDADLLGTVQSSETRGESQDSDIALCGVRNDGCLPGRERIGTSTEGASVLLRSVPGSVHGETFIGANGEDQSGLCLGENEDEQPDGEPRREGKNADDASRNGMATADSRRQWERANASTTPSCVDIGLGYGSDRENRIIGQGRDGLSVALQDRHCLAGVDGCDRSGRGIALRGRETGAGPEKGYLSPVARVVRVEVLEPGSDGTFGGLCPDGFVYNIEVEDNHNYFANGLLVHNCHHATASSYKSIYEHFESALHLGVTATADRTDGTKLGKIYQSVAYEMTLWKAMQDGFLCRLQFVQCHVDIDLRGIRTTAGDFNLADLEQRIKPKIEVLANSIRQEVGTRKTIVFTPDVGSAQGMATALASLGMKADYASCDDKERKRKVEQFHAGELQVLCNCMLFTEGFDCADIGAVVLCRPTKSRSLYSQMVGRGTRLAKGKENCLIIDFNFLTQDHNLVKAVELFGSSHKDKEVLTRAQEIAQSDDGIDLMEAVEKAEREIKEKREREAVLIAAKERKLSYRKVSYDPLDVMANHGVPLPKVASRKFVKASEAQINAMKRFGIENCDGFSFSMASCTLDHLVKRAQAGLSSQKQIKFLTRFGIPIDSAREMSKADATVFLSTKFGNSPSGGETRPSPR